MNKKKIFKNTLILTASSVVAACAAVAIATPKNQAVTQTNLQAVAASTVKTEISVRADFPETYVHKFMAVVITDGRVNQTELLKYINIAGLAPRTTVTINQTDINYATGRISFKVTLDKYYNTQLELVTEDFTTPALTLNLTPRPIITEITVKSGYPTDLRVDQVVASFAETSNGGKVTNRANLEQYVALKGIPTGAELSIDTLPNVDNLKGKLDFVVSVDSYYGIDYELNNSKYDSPKITLSGFVPRYDPTTITAKIPADYDQTLRVDLFKQNAYVNGKVDMNFLQQYIDFVAVPPQAVANVLIKTIDNQLGIINFDIELSHYYDSDNNLIAATHLFPITLNLSPKIYATTITLLPSYSETITPTQLEALVGTGTTINEAALLKYISINNAPAGAKVSSVRYNASVFGQISLTVELDKYYSADLELKNSGLFKADVYYRDFNLETDITKLTIIPKDAVVTSFFDLINPINATSGKREVNYAELAKFVDLSTLPPEANLSIDLDDPTQYYIDVTNGDLGFKIKASHIYNSDAVLANTPKLFSIDLKLLPALPNTSIKANKSYKNSVSLDSFLNYVTVDNKIQNDRLGEYLDLSLVPTTATFSLQNVKQDQNGQVTFNVVSDKWYNNNRVIDGEYVEYAMKLDLVVNAPSLNWLWITLGSVGGVILLIGLVFWIQKKRDKKIFLF